MPQVMQHSLQELTVLCGQLSLQEQEQVIDYIKNIINNQNSRSVI